jgi:hypothetical protein
MPDHLGVKAGAKRKERSYGPALGRLIRNVYSRQSIIKRTGAASESNETTRSRRNLEKKFSFSLMAATGELEFVL